MDAVGLAVSVELGEDEGVRETVAVELAEPVPDAERVLLAVMLPVAVLLAVMLAVAVLLAVAVALAVLLEDVLAVAVLLTVAVALAVAEAVAVALGKVKQSDAPHTKRKLASALLPTLRTPSSTYDDGLVWLIAQASLDHGGEVALEGGGAAQKRSTSAVHKTRRRSSPVSPSSHTKATYASSLLSSSDVSNSTHSSTLEPGSGITKLPSWSTE